MKKRQHIKGPDPRNPWVRKPQEAETERELRRSLSELKTGAELQSLFGANPENLVRQAGILVFAVARACQLHRSAPDDADIRIMRGLAGSLEDLALHPGRLEFHLESIQLGLAAVERLIERVSIFAVGHGLLDCKAVIADRGFGANDIHQMLGAAA
jgi:hypothetical protein